MARLPVPGQDDGIWGDLLNEYLLQSHTSGGSLKTDAVPASALQDDSVTTPKLDTANNPTGGQVLSYDGSGLTWVNNSGGGVTDHGALTGLSDDDHTQYHNNARGDARYYTQAQIDSALSGKSDTSHNHDSRYYTETEVNSALSGKEGTISSGTTAQYWRGDKSWQTLNKSAVGLANVDNTSDVNKPISTATQTALNGKSSTAHAHALNDLTDVSTSGAADGLVLKYNAGSWAPAADDGGGGGGANLTAVASATNVVITSDSGTDATIVSASGSDAGVLTAADKTKLDGIEAGAEANDVDSVAGKTGVVTLVKGDVGLGNVDNTSDVNKPVSTLTQAAIDAHVNDSSAAHAASAISFSPTGTIAATNVQAAIAEVASEAGGGISDGDKGDITVASSGTVWTIDNSVITNAKVSGSAAIDQSKISGLTSDLALKANLASPTFTGTLTVPTVKITSGSPGSGKVLTSDADGDATWQTPSGGGGGDSFYQAHKALVRFQIDSTTDIEARDENGNVLSLGSTHATVIQAAIDYVKDNGGGDVMIAAGVYNITTPILGRTVGTGSSAATAPVWIRGAGDLWTPPFASGTPFGTVLKWTGGSNSGALLDLSSDCHGYRVSNLTITGQSSIRDCIRIAGAHVRIHDCTVVNPNGSLTGGAAIRVTNGSDVSQDRYVGVKIHACMIRTAVAGAWGVYVESPNSGSNSTDGGISNTRIICSGGAGGGFASINSGGWVISGECHFTGNQFTTNGLVMNSSYAVVSGVYIDVVGAGPSVVLASNQMTFMNNHIACDNKTGTSHSGIDVSGNSITIMGNTFSSEFAAEVDYFVHETGSSDRVVVSGNIGTNLVVAVDGFTNFVNGGSIYVAGNVGT